MESSDWIWIHIFKLNIKFKLLSDQFFNTANQRYEHCNVSEHFRDGDDDDDGEKRLVAVVVCKSGWGHTNFPLLSCHLLLKYSNSVFLKESQSTKVFSDVLIYMTVLLLF